MTGAGGITGIISDIKRFAVHDGPGIRTTLFMKGCPLRCAWCHNPESLDIAPVLSYTEKLCENCGDCAAVCGQGCHGITPDGHGINRMACLRCGACVRACLPGALKIFGEEIEPTRAAELLLEDADFYIQSGGGATFSGGEPLMQPEFCAETMRILKACGVSIAVDTCGDVPWSAFEAVLPYTDLFLYDIKHTDADRLKQWTGGSAARIEGNLRELDRRGINSELRIPVVPGFNDDAATLRSIGTMAASFSNVTCVRLLAYHNLSGAKYAAVGLDDGMSATAPPTAERMTELKTELGAVCANVRLSGDLSPRTQGDGSLVLTLSL